MGMTVAINVTGSPRLEGFGVDVIATTVLAGTTCCGEPESSPVLEANVPSPSYSAVTVLAPTLRLDTASVAYPDAPKLAVPSVVFPSAKLTLPVGTGFPPAAELTTAVKVTAWP